MGTMTGSGAWHRKFLGKAENNSTRYELAGLACDDKVVARESKGNIAVCRSHLEVGIAVEREGSCGPL